MPSHETVQYVFWAGYRKNALHYEDLIILFQTLFHSYTAVILLYLYNNAKGCVVGMVCVNFIPSSTDTGVHRTAHVFALLCGGDS